MSQLPSEIAELCLLVHSYEQRVASEREKLFNHSTVTPELIWRYMLGSNRKDMRSEDLFVFMRKSGRVISRKACELFCVRASLSRNDRISCEDLWQNLAPKTMSQTKIILKARKSKQMLVSCPQLPYQVKDSLLQILEQTLRYELVAAEMKTNISLITQKEREPLFQLPKIQAEQMQVLLIDYAPLRIREWDIVLQHILANSTNHAKHFYSFFLQPKLKAPRENPFASILGDEDNQEPTSCSSTLGLSFFTKSQKLWSYGGKNIRQPK